MTPLPDRAWAVRDGDPVLVIGCKTTAEGVAAVASRPPRPLLVYPAQWSAEADLVGADAVHDQLLAWRDMLGHDRPAADPAKPAAADPVGG